MSTNKTNLSFIEKFRSDFNLREKNNRQIRLGEYSSRYKRKGTKIHSDEIAIYH